MLTGPGQYGDFNHPKNLLEEQHSRAQAIQVSEVQWWQLSHIENLGAYERKHPSGSQNSHGCEGWEHSCLQ